MNDDMEISIDDFLKLPKGSYILIDMRSEASYEHGHIEGAVLTHEDIRSAGNIKLIFYCQYGIESQKTAAYFRKCGFNAHSLRRLKRTWDRNRL